MAAEKMSTNKLIIAGFTLVITYAILFALSAAYPTISGIPIIGLFLSIPGFSSPMFFTMPFFGFFALFLLVDWANEYFETKAAMSPLFPVLFFVLSLCAYYVALYWYVANFVALNNAEMSLDYVDFWPKLHGSAFMLFLWAGVFGWIARFAVEKIKL